MSSFPPVEKGMDFLDAWQLFLVAILVALLINYIVRVTHERWSSPLPELEGFENKQGSSNSNSWLTDELIYDDTYASVYNKIFKHDALLQGECALLLQEWTKTTPVTKMRVLDVCSGTGVAPCFFAKQGVAKAVGMDKSPAMIRFSKNVVQPATTLTERQHEAIEWRDANVYGPISAAPGEFTHACLLFFTVYHIQDLSTLFKNLALWIPPGGGLAIEVVNKHKFEPVPEVANPWIAVSPQKHTANRITTSKATFDQFEYSTRFDLDKTTHEATFEEVFRYKDGTKRKQRHQLWMPDITIIIQKAAEMGFKYDKYVDLIVLGFNYGFMLFFVRGESA